MSNTTSNLSALLNEPFPYAAYGVNYEGQPYVPIQWIVDRLNEVVGPLNWRHEFFDVNEDMVSFSVELTGRLLIWDDVKQEWMDRVNYGNDTMTILKGLSEPTAQDRMDCKKSAVSDSLKKCAAWYGVASDVYKGFINVIRPQKNDGSDNPIYQRLIELYGFVERFGTHKNGIPILPDSYRGYYEEKGYAGIFQSDLNGLYSGSGRPSTSQGGQPATESTSEGGNSGSSGSSRSNGSSRTGGHRNTGGSSSSGGNGSRGNSSRSNSSGSSNGNSNKPVSIRMKVLDAPKFNPDRSSTFKAKLENSKVVTVFAGKELADEVSKIQPNLVINSTGWVREDQNKVNLATRDGKIEIEAA